MIMGTPYSGAELVTASLVARKKKYLFPLSLRSVERMCRDRVFKTATKLGAGKRAHWFVSSAEIVQYKLNRNATEI